MYAFEVYVFSVFKFRVRVMLSTQTGRNMQLSHSRYRK